VTWDYIIVGSGSAGCAAAFAIAKDAPAKSILVIEAGPSDSSLSIKLPAGQLRAIATHDWGYQSEPDPSRSGKVEHWSRGRVLGGSSSINGTMYVRGASADYDRWNTSLAGWNGANWSAAEVQAIFREIESSDQPGSIRGHSGPLSVRTVRYPHALSQAFVRSAQACGYPANADYNGTSQEGVAYAQLSQHRGLRCSAADAFLKPLLKRSNVELFLNAHVHRVEMDSGRAQAVWFMHEGGLKRESAKDIILCAGAINTPKLLMLSGIGDCDELQRHGISVNIPLPGVGMNLRDHPLITFTFRTRIPSFNMTEGAVQKLKYAFEYIRRREGPIANIFEAAAFVRSRPSESLPDLQLHFLPVGYSTGPGGAVRLEPYPSVTVLLNKSRPRSSGRIRLKSADAAVPPSIECRILDDADDVTTLIDGVRRVREIMSAKPISDLIESEVYPGPAANTEEAIACCIRQNAGIAYHPVGTCKMGLGDDAVVTPDLRVRNTENLWIADASIMPDLISGNTNAACMMIGAKLGKELSRRDAGFRPRQGSTVADDTLVK
jgi:choline dehydrogenase